MLFCNGGNFFLRTRLVLLRHAPLFAKAPKKGRRDEQHHAQQKPISRFHTHTEPANSPAFRVEQHTIAERPDKTFSASFRTSCALAEKFDAVKYFKNIFILPL